MFLDLERKAIIQDVKDQHLDVSYLWINIIGKEI